MDVDTDGIVHQTTTENQYILEVSNDQELAQSLKYVDKLHEQKSVNDTGDCNNQQTAINEVHSSWVEFNV
ncbi:hypothetical protein H5410_028751 [Solanum commersonii]|uniref:Uncharacterized protein n=1 Tax=Solanum commersonii TaxID=4109 RepID=A0A9J5Z2T4_SOLCO|nr:hypothetical protein H5410_028751 [Solanum commersonii]